MVGGRSNDMLQMTREEDSCSNYLFVLKMETIIIYRGQRERWQDSRVVNILFTIYLFNFL